MTTHSTEAGDFSWNIGPVSCYFHSYAIFTQTMDFQLICQFYTLTKLLSSFTHLQYCYPQYKNNYLCHLYHKWNKLTMAITQLNIIQMVRTMRPRVTHRCRFQIWNQISHINNIFVDIRCSILN